MKAVVYSAYGPPDGLHLIEVATPTPADDEVLIEVLIKVQAVSVNWSDWEHLTGKPLYARFHGLCKPKRGSRILGSDIAGRVERAGRNHRQFHPGDEVHGEMWLYHGGFAEYVCTSGGAWALKPPRLTFEQAAAIPLLTADACRASPHDCYSRSSTSCMRVMFGAGAGAPGRNAAHAILSDLGMA